MAVFLPIAWQLLELRTAAREEPNRPATELFARLQIALMQRHKDVKLKADPTARDAMLAVARLGGHIKNNGEPGWIVLGRGMEKLMNLEAGARLALEMAGHL